MSAGIQANARGCAKLASIMASKGEDLLLKVPNLMSRKSWKIMHSEPKAAIFGDMPGKNYYTLQVIYSQKHFFLYQLTHNLY